MPKKLTFAEKEADVTALRVNLASGKVGCSDEKCQGKEFCNSTSHTICCKRFGQKSTLKRHLKSKKHEKYKIQITIITNTKKNACKELIQYIKNHCPNPFICSLIAILGTY